jgi:hypothetical protein
VSKITVTQIRTDFGLLVRSETWKAVAGHFAIENTHAMYKCANSPNRESEVEERTEWG